MTFLILASASLGLSQTQLDMAAAAIRAQGFKCRAITSIHNTGNAYRVNCGRIAYRVTVRPWSLRPW